MRAKLSNGARTQQDGVHLFGAKDVDYNPNVGTPETSCGRGHLCCFGGAISGPHHRRGAFPEQSPLCALEASALRRMRAYASGISGKSDASRDRDPKLRLAGNCPRACAAYPVAIITGQRAFASSFLGKSRLECSRSSRRASMLTTTSHPGCLKDGRRDVEWGWGAMTGWCSPAALTPCFASGGRPLPAPLRFRVLALAWLLDPLPGGFRSAGR